MSQTKLSVNLLQTVSSPQADVMCCAFSGRLLAIGGADKQVRLFSLEQDQSGFTELPQSPLCAHCYAVNFCHFSPSGGSLASASQDGKAIIWDTRTGRKITQFEHESGSSIRVCQFSPDGRLLATGCDDETAALWDVPTKKHLRYLEGHESSVVSVAFSPDGSYLCTGSSLGDLKVWDAKFGSGRHMCLVKEAHDLGVTCAQFSPTFGAHGIGPQTDFAMSNMYLLATGGTDNLVKLWRVTICPPSDAEVTVTEYTVLEGHTQNVMTLCFSPQGHLLASGSGDKSVIIWEPIKGLKLHQIDFHQRYVTCCAFSSDGQLLATGSNDKCIAVWTVTEDSNDGKPIDLIDLYLTEEENHNKPPPVNMSKPVSDWSVDDVMGWVCYENLKQYSEKFKTNQIDGQELLLLTDTMMKNSIGIEPLAHRNRLLRGINRLRDRHQYQPANVPLKQKSPRTERELPHEYYCPITHEVMQDPVIAADGYTYERSAITNWIQSGSRTSPMTNTLLNHLDITPNRSLKMLIQKNGH